MLFGGFDAASVGMVVSKPPRIPARNPANTGDSAKKKANSAELALDWWWRVVDARKTGYTD